MASDARVSGSPSRGPPFRPDRLSPMDFHRWTDRSQPQTLQLVVILFYINAVFGVFSLFGANFGSNASYATAFFVEILRGVGVVHFVGGFAFASSAAIALIRVVGVAMVAAQALAGLALANERKWGYRFSIAIVAIELAGIIAEAIDVSASTIFSLSGLLGLLFVVVMLVLLLHQQSREYTRIWFR